MALRDKIVIRLDAGVPPKDRVLTVEATGTGATVQMEATPPGITGLIEINEKTRTGKVKNWKRVNPDHVVAIEFERSK